MTHADLIDALAGVSPGLLGLVEEARDFHGPGPITSYSVFYDLIPYMHELRLLAEGGGIRPPEIGGVYIPACIEWLERITPADAELQTIIDVLGTRFELADHDEREAIAVEFVEALMSEEDRVYLPLIGPALAGELERMEHRGEQNPN